MDNRFQASKSILDEDAPSSDSTAANAVTQYGNEQSKAKDKKPRYPRPASGLGCKRCRQPLRFMDYSCPKCGARFAIPAPMSLSVAQISSLSSSIDPKHYVRGMALLSNDFIFLETVSWQPDYGIYSRAQSVPPTAQASKPSGFCCRDCGAPLFVGATECPKCFWAFFSPTPRSDSVSTGTLIAGRRRMMLNTNQDGHANTQRAAPVRPQKRFRVSEYWNDVFQNLIALAGILLVLWVVGHIALLFWDVYLDRAFPTPAWAKSSSSAPLSR